MGASASEASIRTKLSAWYEAPSLSVSHSAPPGATAISFTRPLAWSSTRESAVRDAAPLLAGARTGEAVHSPGVDAVAAGSGAGSARAGACSMGVARGERAAAARGAWGALARGLVQAAKTHAAATNRIDR